MYADKRNAHRALLGKGEGKILLKGRRRRLKDNIKMDLREIGCDGVDGIDLDQNRDQWRTLVGTVMYLRFP
jgi:hypothetical protein